MPSFTIYPKGDHEIIQWCMDFFCEGDDDIEDYTALFSISDSVAVAFSVCEKICNVLLQDIAAEIVSVDNGGSYVIIVLKESFENSASKHIWESYSVSNMIDFIKNNDYHSCDYMSESATSTWCYWKISDRIKFLKRNNFSDITQAFSEEMNDDVFNIYVQSEIDELVC